MLYLGVWSFCKELVSTQYRTTGEGITIIIVLDRITLLVCFARGSVASQPPLYPNFLSLSSFKPERRLLYKRDET